VCIRVPEVTERCESDFEFFLSSSFFGGHTKQAKALTQNFILSFLHKIFGYFYI